MTETNQETEPQPSTESRKVVTGGSLHLILLLYVVVAFQAFAVERERPNIVFFLIDDCSTHEFGCYGNKVDPTPNIDRLAAGGIRLNAAWGTPLCIPSRALLLSGQYGFKTGIYDNGVVAAQRGDLPNRITPLSRTLQQAGYATFMGGKWHLEGLPGDKAWGFDEYVLYGSLCEAASHNQAWRARYQDPWWPWPGANRKVLAQPSGQCHPYATWQPMIIRNGEFLETGPDDFGPDILSRDVSDFIRRKAREPKPFFVYYDSATCSELTRYTRLESANIDSQLLESSQGGFPVGQTCLSISVLMA